MSNAKMDSQIIDFSVEKISRNLFECIHKLFGPMQLIFVCFCFYVANQSEVKTKLELITLPVLMDEA